MTKCKPLPPVTDLDVCDALIEKFGADYQTDRAIEEMSELTKELLKYRRKKEYMNGVDENDIRQHISEEMADVIFTLTQIMQIFKNKKEITQEIEYKLYHARTMLGMPHKN